MIDKLKKHTKTKGFLQFLFILAILAAGIGGFMYLKSLKKPPVKQIQENLGPLVNVEMVEAQNVQILVNGFGTVQAKVKTQLIPEVSGKVIEMHPNLVAGGFFQKDVPLIVIDPRNYQLAVDQARAEVARAQVKLEQEQAEADVALEEWQAMHPGEEPTSTLVLREPQIREARANLAAAHAQLEKAQLDLQRTKISLPFDGRVVDKEVDLGQYITPGKAIANVYGTDVVEIPVPLEDKQLAWFDIPNNNHTLLPESEPVEVSVQFAGKRHLWPGRIARSEAQIDQASRMVYVIIEVEKPFDPTHPQHLVPGMFADVIIKGTHLSNVMIVPNHAVHNNNQVWVINDNRLHIKTVQIARQTDQYSYITDGLDNNSAIITSPIDTITDGMKVRAITAVSNQQSAVSEKGEAQ